MPSSTPRCSIIRDRSSGVSSISSPAFEVVSSACVGRPCTRESQASAALYALSGSFDRTPFTYASTTSSACSSSFRASLSRMGERPVASLGDQRGTPGPAATDRRYGDSATMPSSASMARSRSSTARRVAGSSTGSASSVDFVSSVCMGRPCRMCAFLLTPHFGLLRHVQPLASLYLRGRHGRRPGQGPGHEAERRALVCTRPFRQGDSQETLIAPWRGSCLTAC
jgi:hypothetical protein